MQALLPTATPPVRFPRPSGPMPNQARGSYDLQQLEERLRIVTFSSLKSACGSPTVRSRLPSQPDWQSLWSGSHDASSLRIRSRLINGLGLSLSRGRDVIFTDFNLIYLVNLSLRAPSAGIAG
jgi:hypothetical protein